MFELFLDNVKPSVVIAVEERFRIGIGDHLPDVVGYIDLIEIAESEDGTFVEIVDFKTAARRPGPMGLSHDQLHLYDLAVATTGLVRDFDLPVRLSFRVMTKTKRPEWLILPVESSQQAQQRLTARIAQVVRGMRNGVIYPNPGWMCAGCPLQRHCGAWPDLERIAGEFRRRGFKRGRPVTADVSADLTEAEI